MAKQQKSKADTGKATRRPRQKGKIKKRPDTYLNDLLQLSRQIDLVEKAAVVALTAEYPKMHPSEIKKAAGQIAWQERNRLLAQR